MGRILHNSGILLVSLLLIILVFNLSVQTKTDALQAFGFSDFEITEKTENTVGSLLLTRFTATNGTIILKVEHIKDVDTANAKQLIDEKLFSIESLYETTPSPYPDVITRTIECPDKFKPVSTRTDKKNQNSFSYVLYANNRFTYGVCSEDLIEYYAVFHLVYCNQKNEIYQIELFTTPQKFTNDLVSRVKSFEC